MKIKLAIVDKDKVYLSRLTNAFTTKYTENFEMHSFTDIDVAVEAVSISRIDILLVDTSIDVELSNIPSFCSVAYLVESQGIDLVKGQPAICKFQKIDLIYKQIINIYADKMSAIGKTKDGNGHGDIFAFSSPSGGSGTSTVAASYALYLAKSGNRVLYFNLEDFGSSESFFSGEGNLDISDIVFAIKSHGANLAMKLESCVKQDNRGVYFYASSKIALDIMELSSEDKLDLLTEIQNSSMYDYIILDFDFSISDDALKLVKKARNWIWVGDGSEISNTKITRAFNSLIAKEEEEDNQIISRLLLAYNKFSSKTSTAISDCDIKTLGGSPKYEHASTKQILEQISNSNLFVNIL